MSPRSSRRARMNPGKAKGKEAPPEAPEAVEVPPADDLSVDLEEPAGDGSEAPIEGAQPAEGEAVPAPSSASGRKSARRSARRSARGPAESDKRTSKRKTFASPEEIRARKQAVRTVLLILLILVGLGGGGFGLWWFVLRDVKIVYQVPLETDPPSTQERLMTRREAARWFLANAQDRYEASKAAVSQGSYLTAQTQLEFCRRYLQVPVLGDAQPDPNPENEEIGDIEKAKAAARLKGMLGALEERIIIERNRAREISNFMDIKDRLSRLNDESLSLDEVETAAQAFMANPVDPAAGANAEHAEKNKNDVEVIRSQLAKIDAERVRRMRSSTTDRVNQARAETDKLRKQRNFGRALAFVDQMIANFPDADFAAVRASVIKAVQGDWETTKQVGANATEIFRAPGSTEEQRKAAYAKAVAAYQTVIDSYNAGASAPEVQKYVDEAKELLAAVNKGG